MKKLKDFFKTTLLGGLVVILPTATIDTSPGLALTSSIIAADAEADGMGIPKQRNQIPTFSDAREGQGCRHGRAEPEPFRNRRWLDHRYESCLHDLRRQNRL